MDDQSLLLLDLVRRGDLVVVVLERTVAAAPRMIGNDHYGCADVVRVVRLGELVAQSSCRILHPRAVPLSVRRVRRVDVDLYGVDARRNDGLTVASSKKLFDK